MVNRCGTFGRVIITIGLLRIVTSRVDTERTIFFCQKRL
jgi:hypothetical protein